MTRKSTKKMGRPTMHGETKQRHTVTMTNTAWKGLKRKAREANVSLSEYLEALGKACQIEVHHS